MSTALFVGRFQPFHLGHLNAVQQILAEHDEILIGIGSAQHSNTKKNPLSLEERRKIIEAVLAAEGISSYRIHGIPDIDDDGKWVSHVQGVVGDFDVAYTGNPWPKELFTQAGVTAKTQQFIIPISGTMEREMISLDDIRWEEFLHPKAIEILEQIRGIQKIKVLQLQ